MSGDLHKDFNSYLYIGEVLLHKGILPELEVMLCYRGGSIHHVKRNAEARAFVENYKVSAILIDQYLPHCSGLELMHWLQAFAQIPAIIVISSAMTDTEIIIALEAGAADAVPEDVSPRELAARVRACIRKYFHGNNPELLAEGPDAPQAPAGRAKQPLYFNPESRRVYYSDASRLVLNVKEADLLGLLIERHPGYIDREILSQQLFQQPWNPSDRRIDNLVSKLRRVLDAWDAESNESIIETVRNEGYRLRAPIAMIQLDQPGLIPFASGIEGRFTS